MFMRDRISTLFFVLFIGCGSSSNAPPASPASPVASAPAPAPAPESPPAAAEQSTPSVSPGINARYQTEDGRALSVKVFEDPERAAYQKPDDLMKNLGIKPGDAVADVAAGTGYMATRLSAAVGPHGKVYEEDVQDEFLQLARDKVTQNKLTNVDVVLGDGHNTKLPAGCCDLVIVLDAYHHFEWPGDMLASIAKAMKPNGRLIIVEFPKKPNPVFTKAKIDYEKHIRLDYDGVLSELDHYGWRHVETKDFLPYQYFAVFTLKQ